MSRRRSHPAAQTSSGLARHEAAARVQLLLRERTRLLREAKKKKRQLATVQQRADSDARATVTQMAPLRERHEALVRRLTALFDELLADSRLAARARRHLLGIRSSLRAQGAVLSSTHDEQHDDPADVAPDDWPGSGPRDRPRHEAATQQRNTELPGASQVGQERRSLRELFRSLARIVHPDQARDDAERSRRTELMKELTRAYEDGDLARLLELESTWQSQETAAETGDPLLRCRELERVNRELLDQLREVTRQLRDAKQEARDAALGLTPDELVEQAGRELAELQLVYDFVCRFRDGKLTLSELSRGPGAAGFVTKARSRPRARAAARRPS